VADAAFLMRRSVLVRQPGRAPLPSWSISLRAGPGVSLPWPRRRPSPSKCARCDAQSRFPASQSPDLPLPVDLVGSW